MRYTYVFVLAAGLILAACGGRSAPGLWWTTVNGNNGNTNWNNNNNNNVSPSCGNSVIEPGEECDDGADNSDTRPDACRTNCRAPLCGDGVMDSWEGCDRQDFRGETCESFGFDGGQMLCTTYCEPDLSRCSICGDGMCGYGETHDQCPEDCRRNCGNGVCDHNEDPWSCPTDCGGVCGDGICDPDEDEWICPEDCGYCGDGYCGPYEDEWSCPDDCGYCGDGYCGPYEDAYSCPDDCGTTSCGNGWCEPGEDPWNCPADCHYVCGDGICEDGEDAWSCPEDCGYCGDGYCGPWEDEWSCPDDCAGWCGDGICGPYEDAWSCPDDCGYCGDGYCGPYEDPWSCPMDCGGLTDLSCQAVQLCTLCCAGAADCDPTCLAQGSPTAQSEWAALMTCRQARCATQCASGTTWDCLSCSYQNCPGSCHYDAGGYQGCAEVVSCATNCNAIAENGTPQSCSTDSGIQCWDSCWDNADQVAGVLYNAMMQCVTAHCGAVCGPGASDPDCQSCATSHCQYELNACLSDSSAP